MASINTTARLESKIDALRESMETKIESQNSKYAILIWMIGAGVTLLIASKFIGGAG